MTRWAAAPRRPRGLGVCTGPAGMALALLAAVLLLASAGLARAQSSTTLYAPFICPALPGATQNTAPCYIPGNLSPYAPTNVTCVQYTPTGASAAVRRCVAAPSAGVSAYSWALQQDSNAICYAGVECGNDEVSQVGDFGHFTCAGALCLAQAGDGQPMCVAYDYLNENPATAVSVWVSVVGCVGGYVVNVAGGTAPSMMAADALIESPVYRNIEIQDLAVPVGYRNAAVAALASPAAAVVGLVAGIFVLLAV